MKVAFALAKRGTRAVPLSRPRVAGADTDCIRGLTAAVGRIRVPVVTHRPSADNFLRAAVKTGLRLQRSESAESGEGAKSAGVRTLQRIKRSLQKQNSNSKSKL